MFPNKSVSYILDIYLSILLKKSNYCAYNHQIDVHVHVCVFVDLNIHHRIIIMYMKLGKKTIFSKKTYLNHRFLTSITDKKQIDFYNNNDLIKQINVKLLDSQEKGYYITYLSNLYSKFKQLLLEKHVEPRQLFILTQENLIFKNDTSVKSILNAINTHENFNLLGENILKYFNDYNHKEIAYIYKLARILNVTKNEKKSHFLSVLDDYCLNEINNFDLIDLENLSFAVNKTDEFNQCLSNHVSKILLNFNEQTSDLDGNSHLSSSHDDSFELKIRDIDKNYNYLWLKFNLFHLNKAYLEPRIRKKLIELFFKHSIEIFNKNQYNNSATFYETNLVLNLFAKSLSTRDIDNIDNVKLLDEYLDDGYLELLFENFDLFEYKLSLNKSLRFINRYKVLNSEHLDYLIHYCKSKLAYSNDNDNVSNSSSDKPSSIEFFNAISLLDYLIKLRTTSIKSFKNRNLSEKTKNEPVNLTQMMLNIDVSYKNMLNSIFVNNEKQQQQFIENYNHYLNGDVHVINLNLLMQSAYSTYSLLDWNELSVKLIYNNLNELIKKFNCKNDAKQRNFLSKIFKPLIEISNQQITKEYEIEFCSLIDLNIFYNRFDQYKSRRDLILYYMLNPITFSHNFKFISEKLINDLFHKCDLKELEPIIHQINRNLRYLLAKDKQNLFKICSYLYKDCLNRLNSCNDYNDKSTAYIMQYSNQILDLIKDINKNEDISYDERYNSIFQYAKYFNLNINSNTNLISDLLSSKSEINKNIFNLDSRVNALVKFLIYGNYFSIKNLNQIFEFLITNMKQLSKHEPQSIIRIKSLCQNLIYIMRIYTHFDYTKCKEYNNSINLFKSLNEQFYEKFIKNNLPIAHLSLYARCLLSLDCLIESVFEELLSREVKFLLFF